MKKSHKKILAVVGLILISAFAYKKYGHKTSILGTNSKAPSQNKFDSKKDREGNYVTFWFDGKNYMNQPAGPTVRPGAPIQITEAEFSQAYAN